MLCLSSVVAETKRAWSCIGFGGSVRWWLRSLEMCGAGWFRKPTADCLLRELVQYVLPVSVVAETRRELRKDTRFGIASNARSPA